MSYTPNQAAAVIAAKDRQIEELNDLCPRRAGWAEDLVRRSEDIAARATALRTEADKLDVLARYLGRMGEEIAP